MGGNFKKPKRRAGTVTQVEVDTLIEHYIVNSLNAFHEVESPAFVELIKGLQPDKRVMSRRTLMRRVTGMYDRQKAGLVKLLETVDSIATTCDIWTAHHRQV